MDLKQVEAFIELAKNSGVSELSFESKKSGDKMSVAFPTAGAVITQAALNSNAVLAQGGAGESATVSNPAYKEVTSPFVGTFYQSPSPDAAPYAKVGDRISSGHVLCIIEAMKIMNEIESDISGEIVEICVENETYVEFGQVLFRVKP